MGRDAVHKVTIMRNQNKLASEIGQKSGDPTNRCDVEVVGRFVEQKQIGVGEQEFRQVDTNLKTAGKLARRLFKIGVGKSQSEQDGFSLINGMGLFFRQSQRRFRQNRRLGKMQMLLEMADAIVSRDSDLLRSRVLLVLK